MQTARAVRSQLAAVADPARAKSSAGFFKTGAGQYGEGDVFIGVTVPQQRIVAREFRDLPLAEIERLLASKIHEERLTALIILVDSYERGNDDTQAAIYAFYLDHLSQVNNWDLVDSSAAQIVGTHLLDRKRNALRNLARSKSMWERRVAMVATYAFIRRGEHEDAFAIAELLLTDEHDLIHKATGWMLREVGKRASETELRRFLTEHAAHMPRTALRYAIERLPPTERKSWLGAATPTQARKR